MVEDVENNALMYTRETSGINLFNPFVVKKGVGINSQTGEEDITPRYDTYDYIYLDGTYFVKPFEYSGTDSRIWMFKYDSNKTYQTRTVVNPANYPDGYVFTHTGYIRLMLDNGLVSNAYENPMKYMVAHHNRYGDPSLDVFVPYYAEIDSIARNIIDTRTILNHYANYTFTDLNEINDNSIYYISPNFISSNYPPNLGAAYLQTIRFNTNNEIQFAYDAYGSTIQLRAQTNGTWSSWSYLNDFEQYKTSSIALFSTVGCCGDSFTAGYLYNKPDSPWYDPDYVPTGEYPAISYPSVMSRLYGVDVANYSQSGLTSTQWRTAIKGLPALLSDDPKYLYIISLGLNDKTQNVPVGVEADIDTEPANPTYLGNMGAIIRSIQSHAPYAKIVLCKSLWVYDAGTTTPNSYYTYISQGVELLSTHLGVPYIETLSDPYFSSSAYVNGLKGLHPTAPLYAGIGKRIGELIGKCVIDNPEYFYNFYIPNS